ncbi:MAG: inorganic phosphate transporter [Candidatus Altarchaeum sp.]|nr:inorganic phosphate transporter [Candidatus Altarchaeum sp.]
MMESVLLPVAIVVVIILVFDFINGFHDTANQVSPAIGAKALKPRDAILLAAIMNFAGPFVLGTLVADTVGKIVNANALQSLSTDFALTVIGCAILAAIAWNLITWWKKIPSSSSHTLVGGVVGATVIAIGFDAINPATITKTINGLLFSPLIAFSFTFLLTIMIFWVTFKVLKNSPKSGKIYKSSQIFFVIWTSLGHGGNDATKSMGIIGLILIITGITQQFEIPFWVIFSCSLAMALGTAIGGFKIIRTMAKKMTKLNPDLGFAAEVGNSLILIVGTITGFPMSTTHVITSSIMGAGSAKGFKSVQWGLGKNMVLAWILTIPITAVIAGLLVVLAKILFF